jgi:hypothetical protein
VICPAIAVVQCFKNNDILANIMEGLLVVFGPFAQQKMPERSINFVSEDFSNVASSLHLTSQFYVVFSSNLAQSHQPISAFNIFTMG